MSEKARKVIIEENADLVSLGNCIFERLLIYYLNMRAFRKLGTLVGRQCIDTSSPGRHTDR